MELGTLLELLYSARDRSQTIRATIRRRHRQAKELELLRARGLYRDPPPIPPEEGTWGTPSDVIETTTRVWAARPYRLRWESTFNGDGIDKRASVGVKEGELFWSRFADGEVHTNEQRPMSGTMTTDEERLLDPSALLGLYRFETKSQTALLGRPSMEVIARRRLGVHGHEFGPLSDELALIVDDERGVLPRLAVVVEGERSHSARSSRLRSTSQSRPSCSARCTRPADLALGGHLRALAQASVAPRMSESDLCCFTRAPMPPA